MPSAYVKGYTPQTDPEYERLRRSSMEVGFFFWPYNPELIEAMAAAANQYRYDVVGIADTPGNAFDPWVAAAAMAPHVGDVPVSICVSNLVTRHPAVSAAAAASLDALCPGGAVLGLGAGHSGVRNAGRPSSRPAALAKGAGEIIRLLSGEEVEVEGGVASMPWVRERPRVFIAGSYPRSLRAAAAIADGVYVNFGLDAPSVARARGWLRRGLEDSSRDESVLDVWHVAPLDCSEDGAASRQAIGKVLAFSAGGYILGKADPASRGVPEEHRDAVRELHGRYSTRPGDADAALVRELGLFDYLHDRMAICGTPEECISQLGRAREAGVRKLMLSVSLAHDPVETVRLFGAEVLPALRTTGALT